MKPKETEAATHKKNEKSFHGEVRKSFYGNDFLASGDVEKAGENQVDCWGAKKV